MHLFKAVFQRKFPITETWEMVVQRVSGPLTALLSVHTEPGGKGLGLSAMTPGCLHCRYLRKLPFCF